MTVGVPLIVPNTTIDSYYFDDSLVTFFKANDEASLAEAMLRIAKNPELRRHQVENSLEFVKKFTWDTNRAGYLDLVDFLVNGKPASHFQPASQPITRPRRLTRIGECKWERKLSSQLQRPGPQPGTEDSQARLQKRSRAPAKNPAPSLFKLYGPVLGENLPS